MITQVLKTFVTALAYWHETDLSQKHITTKSSCKSVFGHPHCRSSYFIRCGEVLADLGMIFIQPIHVPAFVKSSSTID